MFSYVGCHNKCAYWVPRASANIGCNHTGVVGEGSEGLNDNLLEILQKEKVNINIVGDFKLNEEIAIILASFSASTSAFVETVKGLDYKAFKQIVESCGNFKVTKGKAKKGAWNIGEQKSILSPLYAFASEAARVVRSIFSRTLETAQNSVRVLQKAAITILDGISQYSLRLIDAMMFTSDLATNNLVVMAYITGGVVQLTSQWLTNIFGTVYEKLKPVL